MNGSAPNWTSIFTLNPSLDPPGYAEAVIWMHENYQTRKALKQESAKEAKRKKKSK